MSDPDMDFVQHVDVPVHDGRLLSGIVIGEEVDPHVGKVYVVRFPSGHTSRLTPAEVIIKT